MQFADVTVETTEDGSSTLRSLEFGTTYHSSHGALQESMHVFIEHGLDTVSPTDSGIIRILEVGFGSGLNALLAWQWAIKSGKQVEYTGIEAFPVNPSVLDDFHNLLPNASEDFHLLHSSSWNEVHSFPHFKFTKLNAKWPDIQIGEGFDIVFFDAFSPADQPEIWDQQSLQACADALKNGGIWVTYCAKGDVRRQMQSLGFQVQRLAGPPHKRHMLHATKTSNSVSL
jgi:tRNA U34 5-methylaminomethyl-2-thiouridine-forming methyltransferase MnmC